MNYSICIVRFPVVRATQHSCRVELSLGKKFEETIVHSDFIDSGIITFEVWDHNRRNVVELYLRMQIFEEIGQI